MCFTSSPLERAEHEKQKGQHTLSFTPGGFRGQPYFRRAMDKLSLHWGEQPAQWGVWEYKLCEEQLEKIQGAHDRCHHLPQDLCFCHNFRASLWIYVGSTDGTHRGAYSLWFSKKENVLITELSSCRVGCFTKLQVPPLLNHSHLCRKCSWRYSLSPWGRVGLGKQFQNSKK